MHLITLQQYAMAESVKRPWLDRGGRCDNWSLQLDKFSISKNPGDAHKHDALDEVASIFERQCADMPVPAWLDHLKQQTPQVRWHELRLTNTSRLVISLARAHALENVGLACQPITGLPWISGTAVKGVVSTWAAWCGNVANPEEKNSDGTSADCIFRTDFQTERRHYLQQVRAHALDVLGSDEPSGARAGQIIFLGGFPAEPVKLSLEVDVVTPHTAKSPVPSFFLVVAANAVWRFPLLAAQRCPPERAPELLNTAATWLNAALEQSGIGAKTAAGYGHFGPAPVIEATATPAKTGGSSHSAAASPAAETYEQFLSRMKNRWAKLAENPDALARLSPADREYAVRFFRESEGLAERSRWGKPENLNRGARESNLRAARLLEEES